MNMVMGVETLIQHQNVIPYFNYVLSAIKWHAAMMGKFTSWHIQSKW